jgi:hypothetical protein
MTPIDVFKKYVAVKIHFNSDKFDYTKSKGYTKNITQNAYQKRSDKYYFEKISTKLDDEEIVPFFVSNFIEDSNMWSGDLASFGRSLKTYKDWKIRMGNLKSETRTDINNINAYLKKNDLTFRDIVVSKENEIPVLLKMYYQKLLTKETMIFFDYVFTLFDRYDIIYTEDPLWKAESKVLRKYGRFLDHIKWSEIVPQITGEFKDAK